MRPSRGTAPSTSKNVPDTPVLATLSGSPPPSPSSTSVQADDPTEATRPTCGVASPMSWMSRYDSSITRMFSAALVPQPITSCCGSRIGIGFSSTA